MGETVEYYVGEGEFRFKFTWDEEKAQDNIEKHGISFEVACWALLNPMYVVEEQEEEDGELRTKQIAFPKSQDCSSLLCVVYTDREDSVRLITAWKATPTERNRFHEKADIAY